MLSIKLKYQQKDILPHVLFIHSYLKRSARIHWRKLASANSIFTFYLHESFFMLWLKITLK